MSETGTAPSARRRWLTILGIVVIAAGILYGLYYLLYARHFVATDDAYVGGDVVSITSRDPATVVSLHADNTETVRRGQLLIEFDPVRPAAMLEAAKAELARTVRSVRSNFSKVNQGDAQLAAARIALTRRKATIAAAPARALPCRMKNSNMRATPLPRRRRSCMWRKARWRRRSRRCRAPRSRTIPMCWRPSRSCARRRSRSPI